MELVFASNNAHKLEEVQAIAGSSFKIRSLNDIGCADDIPETGDTFAENARQKTTFITANYGYDCFGDDSGLEVDALGGEPGVYSARYSGTRDSEANLQLLLKKMSDQRNRRARFKTVICLMINGQEHYFEGTVEGLISTQRSGTQGFGYDPIFIPDGYQVTFAEMNLQEKNRISHRARALEKMINWLRSYT